MDTTALAWIIFGVVALLSWLVQRSLDSKFDKYSQVELPSGLTGADVARKMLADNGITDVTVRATNGISEARIFEVRVYA